MYYILKLGRRGKINLHLSLSFFFKSHVHKQYDASETPSFLQTDNCYLQRQKMEQSSTYINFWCAGVFLTAVKGQR